MKMASIRQRAIEFMQGFNRGDLAEIMDGFGKNSAFVDPLGGAHHGIGAIRAALEPIVSGGSNGSHYTVTDTIVDEAAAKASIAWTLTTTAEDGSKSQMRGVDILHFADERVTLKNCFMKATDLLIETDDVAA